LKFMAPPVPAQAFFDLRGIFLDPAVQAGVVNGDAALFHHLAQVPIADAVFAISADAMENDAARKMPPFEIAHVASTWYAP
jgi:hypothetical protein